MHSPRKGTWNLRPQSGLWHHMGLGTSRINSWAVHLSLNVENSTPERIDGLLNIADEQWEKTKLVFNSSLGFMCFTPLRKFFTSGLHISIDSHCLLLCVTSQFYLT